MAESSLPVEGSLDDADQNDGSLGFCEGTACEAPATEILMVSEGAPHSGSRRFCDQCTEAYWVGVQHGRYHEAAIYDKSPAPDHSQTLPPRVVERIRREAEKAKADAEWAAKYPQHAKLRTVKDYSQKIGEFVEWLPAEKQIRLGYYRTEKSEVLQPAQIALQDLLADFFGIDLKALAQEKDDMLEELRKSQVEQQPTSSGP